MAVQLLGVVALFLIATLTLCNILKDKEKEKAKQGENWLVFDDKERPYRIVSASQGGWPLSLVSGPFDPDEDIWCHKDMERCEAGEGVDGWFWGQHSWCGPEEMVNATHVRVVCGEHDEEEKTLPIECCERFPDGDTAVYETPLGYFHYATYREDPRTMVIAMNMIEEKYEEKLRERNPSKMQPIMLSFFKHSLWDDEKDGFSVDYNIPLRLQHTSKYPELYRMLQQVHVDVMDEKYGVAEVAQELGLNVKGGPFPVTYFSCEQALEVVKDPAAKFFIKGAFEVLGKGIQVKYRSELAELWEKGECNFGDNRAEIIQEAVTDLVTISGSRFDGRVFLLVHGGRVYMHNNCLLSFTPHAEYNATCAEQAFNFSQKHSEEHNDTLVYAFYNNDSVGKPKQWLEATYSNVVKALPIMQLGINLTKNDDKLFHIFGVDVMMRENGDGIFSEINGWPNTDWMGMQREVATLDENGEEAGERIIAEAPAMYEDSMSTMFADFFSIVLGLAESGDIKGRVREVVAE